MGRTFKRARRPEQKAQQRDRILAAARGFLEQAHHSSELSLADVAANARMARSNVYRYFDSREAILLAILAAELEDWMADVVHGLQAVDGDLDERLEHLADTIEQATGPRPLLCHLVSVMPNLLDTAQTAEPASPYLTEMATRRSTLTTAMRRAVPELTEEQHFGLLRHLASFLIGAWPLSASHDPSASLATRRKPRFQRELRRAVLLVARGILGDQ